MPQMWLLAGVEAPLWAFDYKSLNQASADLRGWIPNLFALAARPTTYLEYIGFLIAATGEIPFAVLLAGALDSTWPLQVPLWLLQACGLKAFQFILCVPVNMTRVAMAVC